MQIRNKRLAKNTLFLYVRMLLVMIVALFTSRVVLEVLGFTDYGVYGVVGGVVTIFEFLNDSMSQAASRYYCFEIGRKDYTRLNKIFNVILLSHAGISIIVILLCETVGLWLLYDKLVMPETQMRVISWVFQISVLSSILRILTVPFSALIVAFEQMHIYAYIGMVDAVFKLLIAYCLFIIPGSKLLIYALLMLGAQFLLNLFYIIYSSRKFSAAIKWNFCKEKSLYKEVFGYASSTLIGNISGMAQGQGINILLNIFFGPIVNAARGIAAQVQGNVQKFSNNFTTALNPQIIKLCAEKNYKEMFVLVDRSSCLSFYLLWFLVLPILLNTPYILKLWLGKYPEYSVIFINIVLWISLVNAIKIPRSIIFQGLGKVRLINIAIGGMLATSLPISYIFLKIGFPSYSVFVITLIITILTEFVSVLILKKYIKFSGTKYMLNVHFRCLMVIILSGILPYIEILHRETVNFGDFVVNVLITSLSILITIMLIGFDKNTRKIIINHLGKRLKFING